ncbi:MAG: twin-arginine translocase subunit TatC [Gammaproteobacteria bacterium]|nr:twin-arginine translocase subunit TatC [Gammaproteobacteria bacterium]NND38603.1 twin-arginine translocase subunit TatC [Pseudomonadales bacterium]NNL11563.1 twin-arginine translocase subunit TatC [Pseudomonadales bacterium]NNM11749.1 twin-arginine translocase subunit TatC [Pseudomonadales bacterium]RZV50503.1 MAG: twin-arginine translocase subunit TatC [Pseudomonadales bacterium]
MSEQYSEDREQPLLEHLLELRTRLLRCLIAILVVFLCLVGFSNDLYSFFSEPIRNLLPAGSSMIATEVTAPFFAPFKLSLVLSFFVAAPFILFQLWSFIAPALYSNEKKLAIPLFISSVVLFYLGIAFCYYVVFPLVFGFFTSVAPEGIAVTPDISSYLGFILKLFFAFGVAFEIPVATVLCVRAGITTRESLAQKRPYIIILCFVFGMLLTPPDMISQSLLAIPTWLLFELGLFLSKFSDGKREAIRA